MQLWQLSEEGFEKFSPLGIGELLGLAVVELDDFVKFIIALARFDFDPAWLVPPIALAHRLLSGICLSP